MDISKHVSRFELVIEESYTHVKSPVPKLTFTTQVKRGLVKKNMSAQRALALRHTPKLTSYQVATRRGQAR